jgi:hypothetical protein
MSEVERFGAPTFRLILCARCNSLRAEKEINVEGHIHFRQPYECKDRKECERRKRKKAKK